MFDYIHGNVRCPDCDSVFEYEEQVKWTNDPTLTTYKSGKYIDADDGEYDYATYIRPDLVGICPQCNKMWNLKAIVKNHTFVDLVAFKEYVLISTEYGDALIEYLHRRQRDINEGTVVKIG